jgi:tetratricopeptide (TPR) repeat protein
MVSVDFFLLKKQYDECLQCIDRVEQSVGGDPYLHSLRGNIFMEAGRFADAKAACEKAIQMEPTLDETYWSRITVALKEKNHADTAFWLRKIVTQCNATLEVDELRNIPDYAAFAKSEEYEPLRKWYQTQKK